MLWVYDQCYKYLIQSLWGWMLDIRFRHLKKVPVVKGLKAQAFLNERSNIYCELKLQWESSAIIIYQLYFFFYIQVEQTKKDGKSCITANLADTPAVTNDVKIMFHTTNKVSVLMLFSKFSISVSYFNEMSKAGNLFW